MNTEVESWNSEIVNLLLTSTNININLQNKCKKYFDHSNIEKMNEKYKKEEEKLQQKEETEEKGAFFFFA